MKKSILFLVSLSFAVLANAQIAVPTLDNSPIYGLENLTITNGQALASDIQNVTRFVITSPDGALIEDMRYKVIFMHDSSPAEMLAGSSFEFSESMLQKFQNVQAGDRLIIEGISFRRAHEESVEQLKPIVISVN